MDRSYVLFFSNKPAKSAEKIKTAPILYKLWIKMSTDSLENENLVQKNRPDSGQNENLVRKNIPDFGEIDKNGRILLSRKGFLRWVQIINPNIIPEDFRDNFILYQEMVSDFLFGSVEEHETITRVNHELQQWKQKYSEAGTMVKKKQAELTLLLNTRYQYRIDFKQTITLGQ